MLQIMQIQVTIIGGLRYHKDTVLGFQCVLVYPYTCTGPQLPNCQTQCHFSWLVVSPLRQKSTRSGNLVLAGILAFLCCQNRLSIPPRPSRYLQFSSAHDHRRPLGGRGRPQPTRCLYLQVIRRSQVFSDMI